MTAGQHFSDLADALRRCDEAWEHFTCSEVQGIVDALRAGGAHDVADEILYAHFPADEEGDDHYLGEGDECPGDWDVTVGHESSPGVRFGCDGLLRSSPDVPVPVMDRTDATRALLAIAGQVVERADGSLYILWPDGRPGVFPVSEDGRFRMHGIDWQR